MTMSKAFLLPLMLLCAIAAPAQDTKTNGSRGAEEQQRLPRVLLIGDSIASGYTEPVRQALAGKATIGSAPGNGFYTVLALTNLHNMLGDGHWDVINFNWGLNDLEGRRVRLPRYEANLQTLVKQLKQTGAKLVWCSTTPVPTGKVNSPRIYTDVPEYNAVAEKVMKENGVPINDLYNFALPRLAELQLKEDVHFTPVGYAALGEQVAEQILITLRLSDKKSNMQDTKTSASSGEQHRLPRVLLIGDSICGGYSEPVVQLLKGKVDVTGVPSNGWATFLALTNLHNMLGDGNWDLIHFNWGLNDLEGRRILIPKYEANLRILLKRLQQTGAKLVWCSTTPVPTGRVNSPRIYTDVPIYNAAAQKIMEENGIPIHDLYSFALPRLADLQLKEDVHFTPSGYAVLAEQVADQILIALKSDKPVNTGK
jgi:acyl-CoA thioesterase-1